jgi:Sortase domain
MTGHVAERAGWLFAATLVIVGTSGLTGDRPTSSPTAQLRVAAAGEATTDTPAISDRYLGDPADSAGLPLDPDAALAADAFAWPSVAPAVATTAVAPPRPAAALKPAPVWWSKYHGTNHVWMPTLGITKPVYVFPCSRGTSPDNLVYRWGCAGSNNVYLLGHAYGVFKALHDAYYNGKLRVGMPVVYADSRGRVHLYRVTTWRIVSPVDASWAMASQKRPSMTLQTCVGANGTLRLNVRLVQVSA